MRNANSIDMKGRLYTANLDSKEREDGSTAIYGTVTLEVDEDGTQAKIRFYATPTYSSGKPNRTYAVLEDILSGRYRTVQDDHEDADWLAITGNIDVNYFIGNGEKVNSPEEMKSGMQLRGAFINQNRKHEYCNKWSADLLITGVTEMDEDPERGYARHARVLGYVIDSFRKRLLNVSFDARSEAAINYVLGLSCSSKEPVFMASWGKMLRLVTKKVNHNVMDIGNDDVSESETVRWTIVGASNPYIFGDEATITQEEYDAYRKALADHKQERFNELTKSDEDEGDLAF